VTSQLRAQEIVEKALAASTADGQVTYVVEGSETNLRWASNSLTTNGAMRSRRVVVVSFVDGGAGMAVGSVTRSGTPDVAELVAASERAARDAGPAEDAMPLIGETPAGAGDWDADPAETSIEVFRDFAPALGSAFGDARDRGQLLFGFAEHSMETVYLGTSTGLRLRHDQPACLV
jgi:predicted Zn-dependent protease